MSYFVIHTIFVSAPTYALLITITSRTRMPLCCRYLISHSTDSLKAPSFAAFTVGLFRVCTAMQNEHRDSRVKTHEDAPNRREQQIRGMHLHSRCGGIRARSLQIFDLLLHLRTLGTTRHARSYWSGEEPRSSTSAVKCSALRRYTMSANDAHLNLQA
jgi:hypothetical protein